MMLSPIRSAHILHQSPRRTLCHRTPGCRPQLVHRSLCSLRVRFFYHHLRINRSQLSSRCRFLVGPCSPALCLCVTHPEHLALEEPSFPVVVWEVSRPCLSEVSGFCFSVGVISLPPPALCLSLPPSYSLLFPFSQRAKSVTLVLVPGCRSPVVWTLRQPSPFCIWVPSRLSTAYSP